MTIYASKTPRDLNHDPKPFVWNGHTLTARKREDCRTGSQVTPDYLHDPRPEFDHVQHNEPNPILLAFRDHVAWRWVYLPVVATYAEDAETFLAGLDADPILDTTPAHHDHARRVLTRLAALEGR